MIAANIHVEGKTTEDLLLALEEVTRKVREGFTSGFDSNEDGRFQFDLQGSEEPESPELPKRG